MKYGERKTCVTSELLSGDAGVKGLVVGAVLEADVLDGGDDRLARGADVGVLVPAELDHAGDSARRGWREGGAQVLARDLMEDEELDLLGELAVGPQVLAAQAARHDLPEDDRHAVDVALVRVHSSVQNFWGCFGKGSWKRKR